MSHQGHPERGTGHGESGGVSPDPLDSTTTPFFESTALSYINPRHSFWIPFMFTARTKKKHTGTPWLYYFLRSVASYSVLKWSLS